jgi:hypothetical protein
MFRQGQRGAKKPRADALARRRRPSGRSATACAQCYEEKSRTSGARVPLAFIIIRAAGVIPNSPRVHELRLSKLAEVGKQASRLTIGVNDALLAQRRVRHVGQDLYLRPCPCGWLVRVLQAWHCNAHRSNQTSHPLVSEPQPGCAAYVEAGF